jgi:hypothetical protein
MRRLLLTLITLLIAPAIVLGAISSDPGNERSQTSTDSSDLISMPVQQINWNCPSASTHYEGESLNWDDSYHTLNYKFSNTKENWLKVEVINIDNQCDIGLILKDDKGNFVSQSDDFLKGKNEQIEFQPSDEVSNYFLEINDKTQNNNCSGTNFDLYISIPADVGPDEDGDGIYPPCDNCPDISNPNQDDFNGNGIGDACEDNGQDEDAEEDETQNEENTPEDPENSISQCLSMEEINQNVPCTCEGQTFSHIQRDEAKYCCDNKICEFGCNADGTCKEVKCSDCGNGAFNLCDKNECESMGNNCAYFDSSFSWLYGGKCEEIDLQCSETDNGKDIYKNSQIEGFIRTDSNGFYDPEGSQLKKIEGEGDKCLGKDEHGRDKILELYCEGGLINKEELTCKQGFICKDGMCIEEEDDIGGLNPTVDGSPWNLNNYEYENINLKLEDGSPSGFFFSSDGSRLYEVDIGGVCSYGDIEQFSCSTPWDVSSCDEYEKTRSIKDPASVSILFSSDGSKFYEVGYLGLDKNHGAIYEFSCSTPWDIGYCKYENKIKSKSVRPWNIFFKPDGTKFYEIGDNNKIHEFSCSTPWDLSSCFYNKKQKTTKDSKAKGVFFNPSGSQMFELGYGGIYQYSCSPWDLSSCEYDGIKRKTLGTMPSGFFFKPDGSKFYELDAKDDYIHQHYLKGDGSCSPDCENKEDCCANFACGQVKDGCGNTYTCGSCEEDTICDAGECISQELLNCNNPQRVVVDGSTGTKSGRCNIISYSGVGYGSLNNILISDNDIICEGEWRVDPCHLTKPNTYCKTGWKNTDGSQKPCNTQKLNDLKNLCGNSQLSISNVCSSGNDDGYNSGNNDNSNNQNTNPNVKPEEFSDAQYYIKSDRTKWDVCGRGVDIEAKELKDKLGFGIRDIAGYNWSVDLYYLDSQGYLKKATRRCEGNFKINFCSDNPFTYCDTGWSGLPGPKSNEWARDDYIFDRQRLIDIEEYCGEEGKLNPVNKFNTHLNKKTILVKSNADVVKGGFDLINYHALDKDGVIIKGQVACEGKYEIDPCDFSKSSCSDEHGFYHVEQSQDCSEHNLPDSSVCGREAKLGDSCNTEPEVSLGNKAGYTNVDDSFGLDNIEIGFNSGDESKTKISGHNTIISVCYLNKYGDFIKSLVKCDKDWNIDRCNVKSECSSDWEMLSTSSDKISQEECFLTCNTEPETSLGNKAGYTNVDDSSDSDSIKIGFSSSPAYPSSDSQATKVSGYNTKVDFCYINKEGIYMRGSANCEKDWHIDRCKGESYCSSGWNVLNSYTKSSPQDCPLTCN